MPGAAYCRSSLPLSRQLYDCWEPSGDRQKYLAAFSAAFEYGVSTIVKGPLSPTQVNTKIFSTSDLKDSLNDDIRFPYDKWNIWEEDYR